VEVQTLSLGDGETYPKRGDALLVHYVGTLAKGGEEFDSSLGAGKPFKFQLGAGMVIRGWEVGVKRISLGERAKIKVAADFAYGAEGIQGAIPPFADLDFEVHLLAINGKYNKNATKAAKACVIQ
jgi:FK506-binding protein 1